MAEGLAAIGLAGNIIQFISFGSALVSKGREIHQSATGLSTELVDLSLVSQDIEHFNSQILASAHASTQLRDIAMRSDVVAQDLLRAISDIQKNDQLSTKGPTKWRSFRRALKCIWKKEQIEEMRSRLELLRDQLSLHLISNTGGNQLHLLQLLKDWRQQNEQTNYQITKDIQALDIQLSYIKQHNSRFSFEHDYWTKLHDLFFKVSTEVRLVSQAHTILGSLLYDCMEVRNEAIKDAHKRTFDWIFAASTGQGKDSHLTVSFTEWLQSGSGIYWVTGKPGSGKSTLMKYLYNHVETVSHLSTWARAVTLVRASFYFWSPGQDMQKSLRGLLQTLLYHILRTCPELVPILCPERSKEQHSDMKSVRPWTLKELQESISAFRAQPPVAAKFYFHIDGLDEYYGDSCDVINTLKHLADCPNVKLCLSSRPWNIFQDAFGRSNACMLRLHEWTRKDIEIFAYENLVSYTAHSDFEPRLFDDLIQDIVNRAQGVFLWVRLVVHSLRDGLINADPVSILHERLRVIPTDLEELFENILESVEDVYRTRMASTFLAALHTHQPLMIIHYHFLEQDDSPLGLELPSTQWPESKIQETVLQTHRRLNGRFKGLLEPASTGDIEHQTRVDFLHRTLRDFLATGRMMEWLRSRASDDLNVALSICRAMIATYKFIDLKRSLDDIKIAIELASHAAQDTGDTAQSFAVVDLAEIAYQQVRPNHSHASCGLNCYIARFAISVGHTRYLHYRFQKDGVKLNLNSILGHAVEILEETDETFEQCLPLPVNHHVSPLAHEWGDSPHLTTPVWNASTPSIIKILLELGADPNAPVKGVSSWIAFLNAATRLMDGPHNEQYLDLLKAFYQGYNTLNSELFDWQGMLYRKLGVAEHGLQNTCTYLQQLFLHGVSPNIATQGTTLFGIFLRFLTQYSASISGRQGQLQNEILYEFLRSGADVTQIYRDESSKGWLNTLFQELLLLDRTISLPLRVVEFQILLQHGLDLNTISRDNFTIWDWLLGAIHKRLQQACFQVKQHQTIRRILQLSLQFRANPYARGFPRILRWVKSRSCLLSAAEKLEIEQALPADYKKVLCKVEEQHRGSEQTQPGGSLSRAATHAGAKTQHAQKRKGGNTPVFEDALRTKKGKHGRCER